MNKRELRVKAYIDSQLIRLLRDMRRESGLASSTREVLDAYLLAIKAHKWETREKIRELDSTERALRELLYENRESL